MSTHLSFLATMSNNFKWVKMSCIHVPWEIQFESKQLADFYSKLSCFEDKSLDLTQLSL